ncbi:hypothetical protein [Mediterranea massiliensis]|uniref:hypothetical protein n=1 Tax=Mediterranea massiliensis TaxID=1841865 RepID=UPI0009352553|nr:hypothetical protein [Mediterranea massiliensis]
MKTRHLAAMAMPLLLVACSQEELLNSNENTSLSNRKVVENVTIRFDEPTTRLAFDGKYKWENGDKFGACLMDEFLGENPTWFSQFELQDYIQSNYPFTRQEGGNWTNTEAVMQEGNYFFYYPYNSNLGGKRTPIRIIVPTNQVLEDGAATSSVLDNQLFAAYAPIVADPTKGDHEVITNLTMEPLLAFPAFNITNNTGNPFTVYRIAITGTDEGANPINFPTVLEVKPATGGFENYKFASMNADTQRAEIMKIVSKNDDDVTSKVCLVFGEKGQTLNNGDKFTSYIMLPPASMLDNGTDGKLDGLKLELYTDKGLVTVALNSNDPNDTNKDDIKVQNPLTTYEYNDGHITYITLDEKAFATPNSMEVSSTRDLEDLVTWNKNTQGTIKANIANDVTLSKAVYDVLAANSKLNLQLEGTAKVTIPTDAPANALNRVQFVDGNKLAVINEANLTLSANFAAVAPASLTNEEGASIVVAGNAFTANNLVNKGTITFDSANDKAITLTITKADDFTNDVTGKVVFASNATYTENGIENWGEVTINEKTTLKGKIDNNAISVTGGYVDGKIYVNGSWTLVGILGKNNGKIVVAKTGTIVVPSGAAYNNTGSFPYNIGSKVYTYDAMIENSGVINNITNNSFIIMEDADARLQSNPDSEGLVDNTVRSPYVQKSTKESIYVDVSGEKKASEVANLVKQSNAKILYISGTLTIDPAENETEVAIIGEEADLSVIVDGNLNIKGEDGNKVWFKGATNQPKFIVESGTTILESGAKLGLGTGTVEVNNSAKLIIQAGAEILCGIDKLATGNVEVYGTWTKNSK